MKYEVLIILAIGLIIGWASNSYFTDPKVISETVVRDSLVTDTLYVDLPPDTLYLPAEVKQYTLQELVANGDITNEQIVSVYNHLDIGAVNVPVEVAEQSFMFSDSAKFHVKYMFPPISAFKVEYDPAPRLETVQTIYQTKTVVVKERVLWEYGLIFLGGAVTYSVLAK